MELQGIGTPESNILLCFASTLTYGAFQDYRRRPGARGDRSKAARMKYLLVAKFTIPKSYVPGEFEGTGENLQEDREIGYQDLFEKEKSPPLLKRMKELV